MEDLFQPEREVEVNVTLTLSKTIKVKTDQYTINVEEDEDGHKYETYNYDNDSLKARVSMYTFMPSDVAFLLKRYVSEDSNELRDVSGWTIDEFTVEEA